MKATTLQRFSKFEAALLVLAIALLLSAIVLPGDAIAGALSAGGADRFTELSRGADIFRAALGATAVLLAVGVFAGGWLDAPGMPARATGLRVGPNCWEGKAERTPWGPIVLMTGLALGLRLINLNNDLWLDEIATMVDFAKQPFMETLTSFAGANQHIFFAALANLSVRLFGESHWALRLPAVLFGVGSVPALYYFAKALTSKSEVLWTMALFTVSYHAIWFSQSARGWSGLVFFSLLGGGLFLKGLAQNKLQVWTAYAAVMALGIFTHLSTLFVFLGHGLSYLFILPQWSEWKTHHWPLTGRYLWAGILTGTLSLSLHSFILPGMLNFYTTTDTTGVGWTNPLDLIGQMLQGLLTGFLGVGLLVLGGIALVGFVSYWRQSKVFAALLAFPAVVNVIALVGLRVGGYPRAFLYVLPLAFLMAVRGAFGVAEWAGKRTPVSKAGNWIGSFGGATLLGVLAVASLASLLPYYQIPKQDYTGALEYVEALQRPGDVVAAVGLAATSYREYYAPDLEFPETAEELSGLRGKGYTTWVIYTFQRDMRIRFSELYDYIESDFTLVASFPGTVGDGTVWVARAEGSDG